MTPPGNADADSPESTDLRSLRAASLFQGALGIFGTAICLAAWLQAGHAHHAVAAAAFAIITPAWYAKPIRWGAPIRQAISLGDKDLPMWAGACVAVSMVLLATAILMRLWE